MYSKMHICVQRLCQYEILCNLPNPTPVYSGLISIRLYRFRLYRFHCLFFQIYAVILSNCVYPDIPHPAVEFLKMEQMFDEQGKVCYDVLKEHLKQEGRVEEDVALR